MIDPAGSRFAHKVAGTFAAKAASFGLGLITTFLIARLLGPGGRGQFYLLTLLPTTLLTLGQLGLPSAAVYFTGRGHRLSDITRLSWRLVPVLAAATVLPTVALHPLLQRTVMTGVSTADLGVVLSITPFLFAAMLGSAILLGRQNIGATNLLSLGQTVASLVLIGALVGVGGMGVSGAVFAYALVAIGAAFVTLYLVARLPPSSPGSPRLSATRLLGYGLRIYPGSLATFFSYRVDVYLLSAIRGSEVQVGLYSLAVGLAELVFYVPDSIATAFFPRIAASSRQAADDMAPAVSRQTILLTTLFALGLVPAATIAVWLMLPAFVPSIVPLVILLPGVVAMSISKVLSGYVSGLGKPMRVGSVAIASLIANVVANILLIPPYGISGAAASSLISYSLNAALMTIIAGRLAGVSPRRLVVPGRSDAAALWQRSRRLLIELADSALRRTGARGTAR